MPPSGSLHPKSWHTTYKLYQVPPNTHTGIPSNKAVSSSQQKYFQEPVPLYQEYPSIQPALGIAAYNQRPDVPAVSLVTDDGDDNGWDDDERLEELPNDSGCYRTCL